MGNWKKEISSYIDSNLESFLGTFFPDSEVEKAGESYRVNPSPCCGHNDCFAFAINKDAANCFSCNESGSRLNYLLNVLGEEQATKRLVAWSGIEPTNSRLSPEELEKSMIEKEINEILELTMGFYQEQLMSGAKEGMADEIIRSAYEYQTSTGEMVGKGRGHTEYSLRYFGVGFSIDNQKEIKEMIKKRGYREEAIEKASELTWVPPHHFVYPYYKNGKLVRINTKAFIIRCLGSRGDNGKPNYDCAVQRNITQKDEMDVHTESAMHKSSPLNFSRGERDEVFFGETKKKPTDTLILVEGENDAISVFEDLIETGIEVAEKYTILALGGNPKKGAFKSPVIRQFKKIIAIFDNDDKGRQLTEQLNEEAADVRVHALHLPGDRKDIDEFLKEERPKIDRKNLSELLERETEALETDNVNIRRGKNAHTWVAGNREYEIEFEIETLQPKAKTLTGTVIVRVDDRIVIKNRGSLDRSLKVPYDSGRIALSVFVDDYYNDVSWDADKPKRSFYELADMIKYTTEREQVIRQLAWYLHEASDNLYNEKYKYLERVIPNQETIAEILKEVNDISVSSFDLNDIPPTITLSQFFHVKNNDAYFYFDRIIQDGSELKMIPFLISNKKEEIRLDLIRRKDEQTLLLVDKKYALPDEVLVSQMEPSEVSLRQVWVDKWKNNEIPKEDLDPSELIKEIDDFIARFVYSKTSVRKVLALWIYSTYYYMLFKSGFPYLMFNGEKGTGKTTYDNIIYLLALNAKLGLDFSTSALFRMISTEGGTFILDEVESLSDKRNADASDYARILKGGYAEGSSIYRTNMDNGGVSERFSAFGPKVISNINGLDDVIADRCITITTHRVPTEKLVGLEQTSTYKDEHMDFVSSITSRCAISALENFTKVHSLLHSKKLMEDFDSGNARLNQIVKPLFVMARFVGGDYEEHLIDFYKTNVETEKEEIRANTLEGQLHAILRSVADELIGISTERWATDHRERMYKKPINYSPETRIFEIDSMHFKTLVEEMKQGVKVDLRSLHSTIRTVLGEDFDLKKSRRSATITLTDESLIRRMGDMKVIRGYRYYLKVDDWASGKEFRPDIELGEEPF